MRGQPRRAHRPPEQDNTAGGGGPRPTRDLTGKLNHSPTRRRRERGEGEALPRNPPLMGWTHRAEAPAATTVEWGRAQAPQGDRGYHHGSAGRGSHHSSMTSMADGEVRFDLLLLDAGGGGLMGSASEINMGDLSGGALGGHRRGVLEACRWRRPTTLGERQWKDWPRISNPKLGEPAMSESERGRWRTGPRRRHPPVTLDLRRRTTNQTSKTRVCVSSGSVEGDGTEDEDGE